MCYPSEGFAALTLFVYALRLVLGKKKNVDNIYKAYVRALTHTHTKGAFMEASGDTHWTGLRRYSDMCGLKLEQLENAFYPFVHLSLNIHFSAAVSFISSSDLSLMSGPPASTHTVRSPHTIAGYSQASIKHK